ncbi:MAG: hypothetical protein HBSAPP03_06270 [Phycisphaerae bacterium]|nr:MAG: hypothetical protein HBSAPP03_06270 [Phycisphaerae bacterium]
MRVDVIGHNFEVTEAIRAYAQTKTVKLTKFFDGLQQVTVRVSKVNHKADAEYDVELILDVEKHKDFVSHAKASDPYAGIDLVAEKGERQLRDFKEVLKQSKHVRGAGDGR